MTTATAEHPWRLVTWSDELSRPVKQIACHDDELPKVLALPFPPGAACRDPVERLTNFFKHYQWFDRRWCPFKVGETFYEDINQGDRPCIVLAIDEHSGRFLYEYEMPGGKTFLRIDGKPVSRNRLPKKWKDLLE